MSKCEDCNKLVYELKEVSACADNCCYKWVCKENECVFSCSQCFENGFGEDMLFHQFNNQMVTIWCKSCVNKFSITHNLHEYTFFITFTNNTYPKSQQFETNGHKFWHTGNGILRWYGISTYLHENRYGY
jgi:hypothetical protein